jgi:hypothetical protein
VIVTVPEAKTVKNRLHLDVRPVGCSHAAEVERLSGTAAGACCQQQPARIGVTEDHAEDAGLDVVEVQQFGQQLGAELRHRGPHRHPLAGSPDGVSNSTRDGCGSHGASSCRMQAVTLGWLARLGHAGHVALQVGHEAGHPGVRQPPGQALDGLGLARAGGPGDQPVAVQHGHSGTATSKLVATSSPLTARPSPTGGVRRCRSATPVR